MFFADSRQFSSNIVSVLNQMNRLVITVSFLIYGVAKWALFDVIFFPDASCLALYPELLNDSVIQTSCPKLLRCRIQRYLLADTECSQQKYGFIRMIGIHCNYNALIIMHCYYNEPFSRGPDSYRTFCGSLDSEALRLRTKPRQADTAGLLIPAELLNHFIIRHSTLSDYRTRLPPPFN